jgi:FkbM family methyltransferase
MTTKPSLPFDIVDGSISRADAAGTASVMSPLRGAPGLRGLLDLQATRHLASALALGRLVKETRAFVVNELRTASGMRAYNLRNGGRTVLLRHGTVDVWTFNELFFLKLYEPPGQIRETLARVSQPIVLDLGANIGLFGIDALERYPGAQITSYEPDAVSAAIHRELIARNAASAPAWTLVEACAGPRAGTVSFLGGQETESRIVEDGAARSIPVPMEDVLPAFAQADLVKLDIEGGEWALLRDERFRGARVVVLEYHPPGCPERDTHAAAHRMLTEHGYTVIPLFEHPGGVGMVWAYQP